MDSTPHGFFEMPNPEADMRRDAITFDLFEIPIPHPLTEASYDFRAQVSGLVGELLAQAKAGGMNRHAVAAAVSRLAGKDVGKETLDQYCSEANEQFNVPLWVVPALEAVCQTHGLTQWLVGKRGGKLLVGRDALNAELGRLERQRDEAGKRIKQLKNVMGEMA